MNRLPNFIFIVLALMLSKNIYSQEKNAQTKQIKPTTSDIAYYTRGKDKIAFNKKPNLLTVSIEDEMTKADVLKLIKDWNMTIDASYTDNKIYIFAFPINLNQDSIKLIRDSIIHIRKVHLLGDILIQTESNLTLATKELIIKWKSKISSTMKQHFINQYGLIELRKIPYITDGFQYRIETYTPYESTDICLKLLDAGFVEFAEPDLYSTSEDD